MTDRILDISEEPAYLRVRNANLVVGRNGAEKATVPFEDLAVLVVSHPQVTYTQAVLSALIARDGAFIVCNAASLPVGMLLPLDTHYVQTERFRLQARAAVPLQKRLWKQIVQAKIKAQGRLLGRLHGNDRGLVALAAKVRCGDPANVEARASRRYWPALFADTSFRRRRYDEDQNRFLNYGYAILRAIVARAVSAAGLHPSLGLHHHNRYNSFCLADDLMEPLRPIVDETVFELVNKRGGDAPLDTDAKAALLQIAEKYLSVDGQLRTIFDAAARMAASLVAVLEKRRQRLLVPEC